MAEDRIRHVILRHTTDVTKNLYYVLSNS